MKVASFLNGGRPTFGPVSGNGLVDAGRRLGGRYGDLRAVLAAGAGVGSYFLFKPDDKGPPAPTAGSIGTVELPLLR